MNPKIELNGAAVLSESTASLSVTAETVDASDAFNRYTLITLKGSLSDNIQTTFPTTATKTSFGIFPFRISDYSSISANDDNFDVMIATTDGIDGPLNQITHNGFFLINGFTMIQTAEKIGTLNSGFVAYGHSSQMDGSEVPTLLRLKGSVGSATNFDSLAIFFDKLTPFFSNYHNDDIYCHSSDGTPYCKFRKGAEEDTLIYNYQTFSRI